MTLPPTKRYLLARSNEPVRCHGYFEMSTIEPANTRTADWLDMVTSGKGLTVLYAYITIFQNRNVVKCNSWVKQ